MDKVEVFKQALQNLQKYADADYMSDTKHWCIVHATQYTPLQHEDGTMYIPSTAMATNFEKPRTTVHTTFNHVVKSHGSGSWNNMPIVVLAPYNDIVKENGNPVEIATNDTYWSVGTTKGFVLPDTAYVVRPSNDVLFNIGEHEATYKRDNYTEEEIKTIVEMMSHVDRAEYEKYKNGDLEDYEIELEFYGDERIKKMYDAAKDKRAFLRGLFEESRFDIISHYLRNIVVRMTMEKMGFRELYDVYDGSEPNESVVETAMNMGIHADESNKGHSNSFYSEMETFWGGWHAAFYGSILEKYGIINAPDLQYLLGYFARHSENEYIQKVMQSIIENKPITPADWITMYEKFFSENCERAIVNCDSSLRRWNQELADIPTYTLLSEEWKEQRKTEILEIQKRIKDHKKKLVSIKKMADFDKNLAEVYQKNAAHLSMVYENWRKNLEKQPGYDKFIEDLKIQYDIAVLAKDVLGLVSKKER